MPGGSSAAKKKRPYRKPAYRRPAYRKRSTYRRIPARRPRRAIRRATPRRTMGNFKLHPFCLAQVNPFLPNAYGARVPDANTAASRAFFDVSTFSLGVGTAAKTMAYMALPWLSPALVGFNSGATATDWAAATTYQGSQGDASRYTAIKAQFRLARAVAHGVRLSSPVSPLNANGYVHLCLNPSCTGGATWSLPLSIDQMKDLPGYKRISLASLTTSPVIYTNRFMDQRAFEYSDVNDVPVADTGVFNSAANGWMSIIVALDGTYNANATAVQLNIENLVHYEGLTLAGSLYIGTDEPSPSSPALMNAVANYVGRSDPLKPDVGNGPGAVSAAGQERSGAREMVGTSNPSSAPSRAAGPQSRFDWQRAREQARRAARAIRDGYQAYQQARPYAQLAGDLVGLVAGADRPLLLG